MKLVTVHVNTPLGAVERVGAVHGELVIDLRTACEAFLADGVSEELAPRLAAAYIPDGKVRSLPGTSCSTS